MNMNVNKNTASPQNAVFCSDYNTSRKSNSMSSREVSPDPMGNPPAQDQGGGKTVESKSLESNEESLEAAPPALPPRPLPRPSTLNRMRSISRNECNCDFSINPDDLRRTGQWPPRSCWCGGIRKYVFLCTLCGALSVLLGALFLTVYFMLKSYTTSLNYFETVPTYIPAAMLMTTGFLISCLACRKNRNSLLMKLCGGCSLACAILCLTVTVTTAVIHMNRLQTLRECYYTQKTLSCTCDSVLNDGDSATDENVKFVFNSTSDCEVIHGVLYSCLRAVFGLSVIGILICIFTCMLVYQLLSHEKKKMYWAQLEMRCRYLYGQHGQQQLCRCCDDCRYPGPTPHDLFPWEFMGNRFLSPGRMGNLYTPSPEDRGEPNRSGWSWRRLPWGRTTSGNTTNTAQTRTDVTSPDSQYGFSAGISPGSRSEGTPYTVIDPRVDCPTAWRGLEDFTEAGFYSWGPPPPYSSASDSPARRSLSEMLSQASPIRRNNNISPARRQRSQQLLRTPLNINPARAVQIIPVGKQQPQPLQLQVQQRKSPTGRPVTLTSAMQLQLTNTGNRSNSMTSMTQNETDNYENTGDLDANPPAVSGFNTLPSLKKRHQPSLSDLFAENDRPRGSFASVTSVVDAGRNENLPPRIYLEGSDDSRLANDASSGGSQSQLSFHIGRHKEKSGSSDRLTEGSESGSLRGNNGIYQNERRIPTTKKKVARKLDYNVITNRNETGRSRTSSSEAVAVQMPKNAIRRTIPKPPRTNPPTPDHAESKNDNQKLIDNLKLLSKDPDLIRKHSNLIKEFNVNANRSNKTNRNINGHGFENFGFQTLEKESNGTQMAFRRTTMQEVSTGPHLSNNYRDQNKNSYRDGSKGEEGQQRVGNECESDVYFGDISNSSCYMSLRSEEPESLYDEAIEPKQDTKSGKALLNKVNLKLIEKESCKLDAKALGYNQAVVNPSPSSLESTGSASSSGCKRTAEDSEHSAGSYCSTRSSNFRNYIRRESSEVDPKISDVISTRDPGRSQYFSNSQGREVSATKRVIPIHASGTQLPNQFRPVRETYHAAQNSNDELSSSSLTADSGISFGRNYVSRDFYNEKSKHGSLSADSESSLEIAKATISGEFSMLFQKPIVHPRGDRYHGSKESEEKHSGEFEEDTNKKSCPNQKKAKCYHDLVVPDDSTKVGKEPINVENQAPNPKPRMTSSRVQNVSTSPKPLPRTTIASNAKRNTHARQPEEISRYPNFLAPDAQYDSQDNRVQKLKSAKIMRDPRTKPALPARPANLPPKLTDKGERIFTVVAPSPRRRPKDSDSNVGVEFQASASHSVNV